MSDDRVDQRLSAVDAIGQAHALIEMGRYPQALQSVSNYLAHNPEDGAAQCLLADIQFLLNDHEAAFGSAKRALELDPNNDRALTRLAWCQFHFKAFTEALALAQAAVKIDPEDSHNLYLLAACEFHNGHSSQALATARQGIRIDPQDADLHELLGTLIFNIEKPKNAIAHFLEALKHNPESASLHTSLAEAYLAVKEMPLAIDALVRAVKLDPQDADTRQKLFSVIHHHLFDVPNRQKHKALEAMDPSLSMFYQEALKDGGYTNKIRLASVVMLWFIGFLVLALVMSLLSGASIRGLGTMLFFGIVIHLLLQLWLWWSNWRLQKKYLVDK